MGITESHMRGHIAILMVLALFQSVETRAATPISKAQLQEMFDSMRRDAPWSVDGPLLWGYFFTNSEPSALKRAAAELQSKGYRVVDISERPDSPGSSRWWLHVEKVEKHTVDTLNARNQEFYALALKFQLGSYDGMDVGPAPK